MSGQEKRIRVEVTAYEGDQEFPEAEHYPEYVAEQLSAHFGVPVECSVGPATRVFTYGYAEGKEPASVANLVDLVETVIWGDFCHSGYRAYSTVATFEGSAPCRS